MEALQSSPSNIQATIHMQTAHLNRRADTAHQMGSNQRFPSTLNSNGLDFNNYSRFVAETENRSTINQQAKQENGMKISNSIDNRAQSKQQDVQSKSESLVRVYKGGHIHTIKNASAFKLGFAHSIYSNEFSINGHNWQIISYLGGETEDVADYISVFLGYVGPFQQCRANWSLRIVNQSDPTKSRTREWKRGDKYNTFQKGRRWGWQKFILQKQAFQTENGFLGEDLSITFEADVEVYGFIATTDQIPKSIQPKSIAQLESLMSNSFASLSSDFEKTLSNGDAFSDTEIECDGEIFRLHSQILATRSPVFARMLSGSFCERIANINAADVSNNFQTRFRVSITDIDPYVVKEMIRFIYTGRINFSQPKRYDSCLPSSDDELRQPNPISNVATETVNPSKNERQSETILSDKPSKKVKVINEDCIIANSINVVEMLEKSRNLLTSSPSLDELSSPSPQPAIGSQIYESNKDQSVEEDKKESSNKRKRENISVSHDDNKEYEDMNSSFDLVAALMEAADKYEIEHLKKLCEAYLVQTLSAATALNTLLLAERHSSQELKHHTLKYLSIVTNLTNVRKCSSEAWNSLDKSLANEILNYVISESANSCDTITGGSDSSDLGLNRSVLVTTSPPIPTSIPHANPLTLLNSGSSNNPISSSNQHSSNSNQNANSLFAPPLVQFPQVFQQFSAAGPAGYFF